MTEKLIDLYIKKVKGFYPPPRWMQIVMEFEERISLKRRKVFLRMAAKHGWDVDTNTWLPMCFKGNVTLLAFGTHIVGWYDAYGDNDRELFDRSWLFLSRRKMRELLTVDFEA